MSEQNRQVLIFRKRLLPYSETFIADQGEYLSRYQAVYAGLHLDDTGIGLLKDAPRYLLDDYQPLKSFSKLLFRAGLGGARRWLSAMGTHKLSIIHAHFLNDGLDALNLKRHYSVPLVTTLHGHDITKYEKPGRFKKGSAFLFEHVDKIIAVSDYIAGHALRKGCPEEKLVKHSIGIDLQRFQQPKQEDDNPRLLFVGRLVEKKGCTYLLQAMAKLKQKYPQLSLSIVGDGVLKPQLQAQAREQHLDVHFLGKQSAQQIRGLLSSHWLFVAPSITADNGDAEGLGMVFLEAQALQTPVVSFRSGGVVEAVEDEKTGLLSEEKDVDSLADHIDTLLSSPALRQQMGAAGRARVEQFFDVRKQCMKLESIYDAVCSGGD